MKRAVFCECFCFMRCLTGIALAWCLGAAPAAAQIGGGTAPAALETNDRTLAEGLQVYYEIFAVGQVSAEKKPGTGVVKHTAMRAARVDTLRRFTGFEKIHIKNIGTGPVKRVPILLYPNSYSSDSTGLAENMLQNQDLRLYFANALQRGSIQQLRFSMDGQALDINDSDPITTTEGAERIVLRLPAPLLPGDSITIATPFLLTLPERLLDIGYDGKSGVSYLKDWFPQVKSLAPKTSRPPKMKLHLTLPTGWHCELNGVLEETASVEPDDGNLFEIQMDAHATLAIAKSSVSGGGRKEQETSAPGTASSAATYFKKLLHGFMADARPVRPDSLMAQMRDARKGDYRHIDRPVQPTLFFDLKEADVKRYLYFMPAFGYNHYDELMAGVLVHNYGLPASKFNFLLAPVYSTKGKTLNGVGRISYTSRRPSDSWQIALDASRYAFNDYALLTDVENGSVNSGKMRVLRIVPSIGYKWYVGDKSVKGDHYMDKAWRVIAKSYILNRDTWKYQNDQANLGKTTTVIGEIKASLTDDRALYPYSVQLKLQGTDQFIRAGLTGNYFLNYDARGNGLQLRGFAGKFFYLKEKDFMQDFNLSNYFFNLSGATGAQDFTNSDYFIGRSEYVGWMSQQMAVSDGFFKVSTPYLTNPVGQTDDWLAAINLTSDLPEGINPFSLLPFRLPVRLFADFGTYGGQWSESPSAGRFLYDAGIQVSLLKEAVTVYFPLLYSKVYRDQYKSIDDMGTFSKRIRFSVSLGNLLPKRLRKDMRW